MQKGLASSQGLYDFAFVVRFTGIRLRLATLEGHSAQAGNAAAPVALNLRSERIQDLDTCLVLIKDDGCRR
jgi:hypothetical protein